MIQRKDSLCYIEFIRGKYKINDINYIFKLFKYITNKENKIFKMILILYGKTYGKNMILINLRNLQSKKI